MTYLFFALFACGSKEGDTSDQDDTATQVEPDPEASEEPSGEPAGEPTGEPTGEPAGEPTDEPGGDPGPGGEPAGEPGGEPAGEPGGEPTEEHPDDFSSTCTSQSMGNSVAVSLEDQSFLLTEAVWDIEQFGFMTIVLGSEGSDLCNSVLDESYESSPVSEILLEAEAMLSSAETYNLSCGVTDGEPGSDANVTFESSDDFERFDSGTLDISSYTYGADMTFSLSVGDSDENIEGTDIKACYCPGALEIIANF